VSAVIGKEQSINLYGKIAMYMYEQLVFATCHDASTGEGFSVFFGFRVFRNLPRDASTGEGFSVFRV
jgi:hypothetical protein